MRTYPPSLRMTAITQALWVTFLWSTSWVLIKFGLRANLPALTFAGLRYSLAFLCLLPWLLGRAELRHSLRSLTRRQWASLAWLGVVYYALAQGAQFIGLAYLPSATLNLLLNFTPLLVALFSLGLGHEAPAPGQWVGISLSVLGVGLYFWPFQLPAGQAIGWAAAAAAAVVAAATAIAAAIALKPIANPDAIATKPVDISTAIFYLHILFFRSKRLVPFSPAMEKF